MNEWMNESGGWVYGCFIVYDLTAIIISNVFKHTLILVVERKMFWIKTMSDLIESLLGFDAMVDSVIDCILETSDIRCKFLLKKMNPF